MMMVYCRRISFGICLGLLSCGQPAEPPETAPIITPSTEKPELSDEEKEFARLSVLAAKGDAKSQTSLAHKYALGKGVKKKHEGGSAVVSRGGQ